MTVAIPTADGVLLAQYGEQLCIRMGKWGVSADRLLTGTGLTPEMLREPGRHLSLAATLRLLANARAIDPAPDLGIRLGAPMNLGSHGFLGYAFQSSRTLGEAFDLVVRFVRTRTSLLDTRIERQGNRAALVLEERYDLGDYFTLVADAIITSILGIGRHLFGAMLAHQIEICLPYSEQSQHSAWREHTGITLSFNSAVLQVRYPAQWLDMPLNTADPQLAALAAARCEEELLLAGESRDIVTRVREIARRYLAEENSLERVADELHLTTRTLRRRLQQAGTSYQGLIDQLRQRLAADYLLHSQRTVEEIAELLGYNDPSNFGRAFRRWTGESPRDYRNRRTQL